jgi:hypothetical protein
MNIDFQLSFIEYNGDKGAVLKHLLLIQILFLLVGCTKAQEIDIEKNQTPKTHSFQNVWNQVISDPYDSLPQDKVSFLKLFSWGKDTILEDSKRTLNNHADILEPFDKLAHPNGICLKGIWKIDKPNRYSGYFKTQSEALIIARASSALSNTKSGGLRAFGFAGKLFPTINPTKTDQENTANFFLIDDLGGTDAKHFTDVNLTNAPKVSTTSAVLKNLLYALKVARSFSKADKNPTIRQLYEISYLGETDNTNIITPKWMKIEAQKGQTVDAKDFRDELHIKNGEKLIFNIHVRDDKKDWQKIGTITFDTSVVSNSCDHRLHFHHPKWRDDLSY